MTDKKLHIAGRVLFALNVFILFLLLFENKLYIPPWLRPVGRMHPMLLHFPIVLMLLSMVMEFFRFRPAYSKQELYQKITTVLLVTGLLSSGVVVVMGLFLSREEGYSSPVLTWHKWFGVGVFFTGSVLYACRSMAAYNERIARGAAMVVVFCVVLSGHYGASLTHGENFIWQPVAAANPAVVPIAEAKIFEHLIKPLLEEKCTGCHNPDKTKGGLMLTDSVVISKGGKSGRLLDTDNPRLSLLLKRIHLPQDAKKHMPPEGKPQLTVEELQLLDLWVRNGAVFNAKIVSLSEDDSLRVLAEKRIGGDEHDEEIFQFAAADAHALQKLNTNYRVVAPLAQGSPAVTVNIYNRDTYSAKTLEELTSVRSQIVSLHLNKMPVTDEDLKTVSRFENLRNLDLNFTDITGSGLASLTALKHLRTLSLSGTSVTFPHLLQYLPLFQSLDAVTVWDTKLTSSQLQDLRKTCRQIEFIEGFSDDGSNPIKLNLPRIKNKPIVFTDSIALQLFHPVRNVEIRYTTDGDEPDSLTSPVFTPGTIIKESTAIKARAYKQGWLSSDVASLHVYRNAFVPDTVILLSRLNRVHPANGAQTFFDHQLGGFNANSPAWANNWAGFIKNDMELLVVFEEPKEISSVAINVLVETETFIFPPALIEYWGGNTPDELRLMGNMKPELPGSYRKPFIQLITGTFKPQEVRYLKIIAKPVMKMPAWHKSKDQAALLLIDEIFLN